MAALTKGSIFAMMLSIFAYVDGGLAQQVQYPEVSGIGTAYEFKGVAKYLSVPSKILLADKSFLGSELVDGYDFNHLAENQCDIAGRAIWLKKDTGKWWQVPVYRMVPEDSRENGGLDSHDGFDSMEPGIIIVPYLDALLTCRDDSVINSRRFVISSEIVDRIERHRIEQQGTRAE